ncbi:UNVERIFIED_CONTAM: hypothetical protein GTU68_010965 [Idotea baltica]|nr:hypothetical protein [Idotea baltica]
MLVILYPACDETRQYAADTAPLTRVQFAPGDEIAHFDEWKLTVQSVDEINGLFTYHGLNEENQLVALPEAQLSCFLHFHSPKDRLLAGQLDPIPWFSLRYQTFEAVSRHTHYDLLGLSGARAQPIAHQLFIAKQVSDRIAPRVLLADEVGLGKTIEAGLIINRQLLTGRAQRVLILVPENLQHQWLVEMKRRFNLQFTLLDETRFYASDTDNPFEDNQLILTAFNWLPHNLKANKLLLEASWDLMIVDEAHHLSWTSEFVDPMYQLVERLARVVPGVLLLTATPEQLGQLSHFARLRLLDLNRFHDFKEFEKESQNFQPIAHAVQEILEQNSLSDDSKQTICRLLRQDGDELIKESDTGSQEAKDQLIRQLIDRHGTGRLLFRNTRMAVQGFSQQENTEKWWDFDTRIKWLLDTLKSLKNTKVLVICAHADTAIDLNNALHLRPGYPASTVFHEAMSIIERDRSAAYFADQEFGAQILISSEIGSEGRNFQFAHHLVLFDLPMSHDLLEQRIGRLDRIGQKQNIKIHVPYFTNSPQERIFQWYNEGLNAFLSTCQAGHNLQKYFEIPLQQGLNLLLDQDQWIKLLQQAKSKRTDFEEQLHKGRDRLLEINSSGLGAGNTLIQKIIEQDNASSLPQYMEKIFDVFGIDFEENLDQSLILRPSQKMLNTSLPLPEEGLTATYDREYALTHEDVHFLTWEHPLVQEAIGLFRSSSMGNANVALIKNKALPPGTILTELIYISEVIAPKKLQLDAYLPPSTIRCLLDSKQNNLADKVSFNTLNDQLQSIPKHMAKKVIRAQRDVLLTQFQASERYAQPQHESNVKNAVQCFNQALSEEIQRLTILQQINPNVRSTEIAILKQQLNQGNTAFERAALRLEAVRVLIVG